MSNFRAIIKARYPVLLEHSRGLEFEAGWAPIVDVLCKLLSDLDPVPRASAIKEKFGGLRFGLYRQDESLAGFRHAAYCAHLLSMRTCEVTGQRGRMCSRGGRWQTIGAGVDEKALSAEFIKYDMRGATPIDHIRDYPDIGITISELNTKHSHSLSQPLRIADGYVDLADCFLAVLPPGGVAEIVQTFDGLRVARFPDGWEMTARFIEILSERCDPVSGRHDFR